MDTCHVQRALTRTWTHLAFDQDSTQSAVYSATARRLVADVLNGYNGCLLVYGQVRCRDSAHDSPSLSLSLVTFSPSLPLYHPLSSIIK